MTLIPIVTRENHSKNEYLKRRIKYQFSTKKNRLFGIISWGCIFVKRLRLFNYNVGAHTLPFRLFFIFSTIWVFFIFCCFKNSHGKVSQVTSFFVFVVGHVPIRYLNNDNTRNVSRLIGPLLVALVLYGKEISL